MGSPLHLLMGIILVITAASEWQMRWGEHLVGAYLAAGNDKRPEIGTVWETEDRTALAQTYLKTIADSQEETTQYAREASSFIQLASGILPGQWTHISRTHFKQLYLALPEPAADQLIPPLELVWLFNGKDIDKIFCEGKSHGLNIYFLTPENRVIKKIFLSRETLATLDQDTTVFKGSLEDIQGFAGTIYPANQFFNTTLTLPPETRSELIIRPQRLLPDRGKISRVGIWPDHASPYVKMGFEVHGRKGTMVIFTKGRHWAVEQLLQRLKEPGQ